MQDPNRYTITAALPYTNGPVHIGHLAGVYVPADIYARYLRLNGKEVAFVCGSDEHGVPITLKAKNEGVTPQNIVDRYHEINKKAFADFGISFDSIPVTSPDSSMTSTADTIASRTTVLTSIDICSSLTSIPVNVFNPFYKTNLFYLLLTLFAVSLIPGYYFV